MIKIASSLFTTSILIMTCHSVPPRFEQFLSGGRVVGCWRLVEEVGSVWCDVVCWCA